MLVRSIRERYDAARCTGSALRMTTTTNTAIRPTPGGKSSQARTLFGISAAHWLSHVHIMTLPPLFPLLKAELGVSYVELGLAVTLFGVISAFTQAPMGVLVDRFGARGILIAGLTLGGAAFMAIGLLPSYPMLLIGATLAGLANSVYHPADYALLSIGMDERRMGRAFSIHTFAGFLGGAVSPVMMALLAAEAGVGTALLVAGGLGPAIALLLIFIGLPDSREATQASAPKKEDDAGRGATSAARVTTFRDVCSPAMLMLMVFFLLLGLSTGGINGFGVVALISGYSLNYETASLAVTLFLGFAATGVLAGGFLADGTQHHGGVAALCFALNALIVGSIAWLTPSAVALMMMLAAAGFLAGVITPSRDML